METNDSCVDGDCETGRTCFKHKLRTIQISPAATPSRRNTIPPRTPLNNWEKGIARDERGMPLLDKNGSHIGLHELAGQRGHIESRLRELKNTPPTPNKN